MNTGSRIRADLSYNMLSMTYEMASVIAGEIGATGYEISWHPGHRPNHTFGGRQYTFAKMESEGINKMLSEHNCKHFKFPVIVGVTPPMYSEQELTWLAELEKMQFMYRGRMRTLYEMMQIRRNYERQIELYERQVAHYESRGDKARLDKAYGNLGKWNNRWTLLVEWIEAIVNEHLGALSAVTFPEPGPEDEPPVPVTDSININTADEASQQQYIWNYIIDNWGLTEAQTAAIMGNIAIEGLFSPGMLQNNLSIRYNTEYIENYNSFDSIGWGLMQWTFWSRKQALLEYAEANGTSVGDMDTQLEFIYLEMTVRNYSGTGALIINGLNDFWNKQYSNDVDYLTKVFMDAFLSPGIPHLDRRIAAANRIYNAFKNEQN